MEDFWLKALGIFGVLGLAYKLFMTFMRVKKEEDEKDRLRAKSVVYRFDNEEE